MNGTHEDNTVRLSTAAQALTQTLSYVLVPYRWSRQLTADLEDQGTPAVYYVSPSGRVLRNAEEVEAYLGSRGSCLCYLTLESTTDIFNFNAKVASLSLPPPSSKSARPRCTQWWDSLDGRAAEQLKTKTNKAIAAASTTAKARTLKRDLEADDQQFDWRKVTVLEDGRVYLKPISDVQWKHLTCEWKNGQTTPERNGTSVHLGEGTSSDEPATPSRRLTKSSPTKQTTTTIAEIVDIEEETDVDTEIDEQNHSLAKIKSPKRSTSTTTTTPKRKPRRRIVLPTSSKQRRPKTAPGDILIIKKRPASSTTSTSKKVVRPATPRYRCKWPSCSYIGETRNKTVAHVRHSHLTGGQGRRVYATRGQEVQLVATVGMTNGKGRGRSSTRTAKNLEPAPSPISNGDLKADPNEFIEVLEQ